MFLKKNSILLTSDDYQELQGRFDEYYKKIREDIKRLNRSLGSLNHADAMASMLLKANMARLAMDLQGEVLPYSVSFADSDPNKVLVAAEEIKKMLAQIGQFQQLDISDKNKAEDIKQDAESVAIELKKCLVLFEFANSKQSHTPEEIFIIKPEIRRAQDLVRAVHANYQYVVEEIAEFNKAIASLNDSDKIKCDLLRMEMEFFLLEIQRLSYDLVYENKNTSSTILSCEGKIKEMAAKIRQLELNIPENNKAADIKKHAETIATEIEKWGGTFESVSEELTNKDPQKRHRM